MSRKTSILRARLRQSALCSTLIASVMMAGCTEVDPGSRLVGTVLTELQSAPTTVEIGGRQITLTATLLRDSQPSAPGTIGGGSLTVNAVLSTGNAAGLPAGMRADSVWVAQGAQLWATRLVQEEQPVPGGSSMAYVARGGPLWTVGASADVIVQLIDLNLQVFRIRAPGVIIQRVE
jgi:hypothetical protein